MANDVSYSFGGKVAIVTGGSNGIGRRIAERLRDSGANVIVWDLAPCEIADVTVQTVDVTRASSIAAALPGLDGVDILVHSAGLAGASAPVLAYNPKEWRRIIDVNLTGTYEVARHVVPLMQQRPSGRVVFIGSLAGKEGTPNAAAYSASKAGVIALTKALGKELAETNIRVNCIAPAAIETELLQQFSAEHVATMVAKSPLGRLGTVDEVAEQVLWMCSDACAFSTGAVFDLSGGRATA
ncbi:MAG: SDR family NAD(P)-dependent oxidoreductase [Pseudomonadota bacterium]